jgi:CrcB protein
MGNILIIGLGAFFGANARYLLNSWFVSHYGSEFPWGTLFINVSGSFVLGFLLAFLEQRGIANPTYRLLLGTGFLGAYTTFSTFSYETISLLEDGEYWQMLLNIGGSLALGLAGAIAGIAVGRLLGRII